LPLGDELAGAQGLAFVFVRCTLYLEDAVGSTDAPYLDNEFSSHAIRNSMINNLSV
jgi:hypothetical protein